MLPGTRPPSPRQVILAGLAVIGYVQSLKVLATVIREVVAQDDRPARLERGESLAELQPFEPCEELLLLDGEEHRCAAIADHPGPHVDQLYSTHTGVAWYGDQVLDWRR